MTSPVEASKENLPSKSVEVPVEVPLMITEAPGSGVPVSSKTVPEMVLVCAIANCTTNAKNSIRRPLILILMLVI